MGLVDSNAHVLRRPADGVMVRVLVGGGATGGAICRERDRGLYLVVDLERVETAEPGDELLVHAGVALQRYPCVRRGRADTGAKEACFPFHPGHCNSTQRTN